MQTRKESAYFVAIFLNYIIQNLFLHKLKNKVEIFIFIKCIYRVKKKSQIYQYCEWAENIQFDSILCESIV